MTLKATTILFLTLVAGSASADAIPPGPPCPKGQTSQSDHGGGYCQPPAPTCAKGETARPTRGDWYCEPPPPTGGCPRGSEWRSRSRTDIWCDGQRRECEGSKDPDCVKTALCVKEIEREYHGRVQGKYIEEQAISVCVKGKACAAGYKCVTAPRYAPKPPETQPSKEPVKSPGSKGALLLLPLFALALAVGAAFRRRRQ